MPRAKLVLGFCAVLFFAQGHSKSLPETASEEPNDYDDTDYDFPVSPAVILSKPQTIRAQPGENVVFPCQADNRGDFPMLWNRNKEAITLGTEILIQDKRFSLEKDYSLMIRDVTPEDARNTYTCQITSHPPVNVTHRLVVEKENEPVVFINPKHSDIKKGESLTLTCKMRTNEQVVFKWSHKGNRLHAEQHSNSATVTIKNATRHHDGIYQCLAETGAGTPPIASTKVTVHYPPEVTAEHETVHTGTDMDSHLTCIVHAHPHAKVTWYHNDRPLQNSDKYTMRDEKSKRTLTIHNTHSSNFGVYTCKAKSDLGEAFAHIVLEGTPSQPTVREGELDSKDDSTFILTWHLQSYSPIAEYKLEYRRKGEETWEVATPRVTDGEDNTFTVKHPIAGIRPGPYEAILSARNDYGWSPKSYPYTFNGEYRDDEGSRKVQGSSASTAHMNTILTAALLVLSSFVYSNL